MFEMLSHDRKQSCCQKDIVYSFALLGERPCIHKDDVEKSVPRASLIGASFQACLASTVCMRQHRHPGSLWCMTVAWSFSRDWDSILGKKRKQLSLASFRFQNQMCHGELDEASVPSKWDPLWCVMSGSRFQCHPHLL